MLIPQHFTTWVLASVRTELQKRFGDADRTSSNFKLFFEMDDNNVQATSHLEVRIDGPTYELTGGKDEICGKIEINILINSTWNADDLWHHVKNVDTAVEMLKNDFTVRKLGFVNSDKSDVGCLQMTDVGLVVTHHGQIDTTTRLYQSSVEAHYVIEI